MTSLRLLALALLMALLPALALGHEMRPGYLEVTATGQAGHYEVLWKSPMRGGKVLPISPHFPPECTDRIPISRNRLPGALVERRSLECGEGGLSGKLIAIDGLSKTVTDVLVRLTLEDGHVQSALLKPDDSSLIVADEVSATRVVGDYTGLGVKHILSGFDHLLFVLGLLLIVGGRRRLFITISAFTLAHSITLAATALGVLRIPGPPVEATIALSILFLASELVKINRGGQSLTAKHPWVVSFAFGLLHGLGFAGALIEVGLPQREILLALLMFNVGVELGQLLFVAFAIALIHSTHKLRAICPAWTRQMPAYGIGAMAAFWFIERISGF